METLKWKLLLFAVSKALGYSLAVGSGAAVPLWVLYKILQLRARQKLGVKKKARNQRPEQRPVPEEIVRNPAPRVEIPESRQQTLIERRIEPVPPDIDFLNLMEREMADIAREMGSTCWDYFDLLKARMRQHLNLPVQE